MSSLAPGFDWQEVARLALASRIMDELEESELTPQGLVTYQFSARGHELGQLLISQLLDRAAGCCRSLLPFAAVYARQRPDARRGTGVRHGPRGEHQQRP